VVEFLSFVDADGWDRWLSAHGAASGGVWVKVAKKRMAGLSVAEAGDVAICHGWIDSQRRGLDSTHFLQRYSPRRPGSPWSLVNVERVAALDEAGRMRPAGQAQVAAAKADGRWEAAYASQANASVPADLVGALAGHDGARSAFEALSRTQQYALYLPLLKARTPAQRQRVLRRVLATLSGER
jgi:uncharacterized protein YdeI (YjbR/CyaY-like superfamily)